MKLTELTHVSLFTGIGGLDLAAERAGIKTVLQVERDPYCLKVLAKHWPDVPRITDVREVRNDERWSYPTVVSGGFPCQPFSSAGKRGGTSDDRHLWPQMLRVIRELSPAYVVGENVSGLLSLDGGLVFETVCADLERAGYDVLPFHYPAASVGAPHRRDRVFIVAHARDAIGRRGAERGPCGDRDARLHGEVRDARNPDREGEPARAVDAEVAELSGNVADATLSGRRERNPNTGGSREGERAPAERARPTDSSSRYDVADAGGAGRQKRNATAVAVRSGPTRTTESRLGRVAARLPDWMDGEPDIPRVATGVKDRTARLRALGNAVVPAQAAPIFFAIAEQKAAEDRDE